MPSATSADLAALHTGLKSTSFLDNIDESLGDFDKVDKEGTDLPPGASNLPPPEDVDPAIAAGAHEDPPADEPVSDEPPADEPTTDTPTASDDDPYAGQSAADRQWGKLRTELADAKKKVIPGLQTELERLKAEAEEWRKKAESAQTPADYAEIKEGFAEAQKQLKIVKLEATDAFKKAVTIPLRQIGEQIGGIAKRNDITPEALKAILEEPDENKQTELLNELTGLLNRRDELRLYDMVDARNTVRTRETTLREDVDATVRQIEESQRAAEAQRQQEAQVEDANALDIAFNAIVEEVPQLMKKNGNPEWDSKIDAIRERAKNYKLDELTPLEKKRVVVALGAYPHVMEFLQAVCQENMSLREAAKARTVATPRVGGSRPPQGQQPPAGGKQPGGFLDAMDTKLGTRNA